MIYECGITEINGRQHRYRHTRMPEAWVFGLQIKGSMWRSSGGSEHVVASPSLGCCAPGTVYEIATIAPHINNSIYALAKMPDGWRPAGLTEFQKGCWGVLLSGHPFLPDIIDAFRSMYRWTRTFVPNSGRLAVNALDKAMLLAGAAVGGTMDRRDDRLHGITGFIFEHMDRPLDVAMLADSVGLSPSRFAHLFKQVFGMPPMSYVERVRLEEAKALLAGGSMPVNAVAHRTGYESEFYFSRRFKKFTGLSPTAFRAKEA